MAGHVNTQHFRDGLPVNWQHAASILQEDMNPDVRPAALKLACNKGDRDDQRRVLAADAQFPPPGANRGQLLARRPGNDQQ